MSTYYQRYRHLQRPLVHPDFVILMMESCADSIDRAEWWHCEARGTSSERRAFRLLRNRVSEARALQSRLSRNPSLPLLCLEKPEIGALWERLDRLCLGYAIPKSSDRIKL